MAKKIDIIKSCVKSCVLLTVKYDGTSTKAFRPTNGPAIVQAIADACKEYGTRGEVTIAGGTWMITADITADNINVENRLRASGHYRRRNVNKARY